MNQRKIIHVDMDAFFASVEQLDNPSLRGKPIAVGYDGPRGVVATASYEARRFGVHSAMPVGQAKRLCPELIVVEGHYQRYKEVSRTVHEVFHEYTDLVEPISLDEAFLDVTVNKPGIALAQDIASEIKQKIRERTQLTASAGVSYNKLLAKIASDFHKPDGLYVIHPDRAEEFIAQLPVTKLWGVGRTTAERMHFMGIFTGADLKRVSRRHLMEVFGKVGSLFYDFARGIDERPVETEWIRKSCGCEQTFLEDIHRQSALLIELYHTTEELIRRLKKANFQGRTLTLKIKYSDFTQATRSKTSPTLLQTKEQILPLAKQLLQEVTIDSEHPIRLMGLTVSHNDHNGDQPDRRDWEEGWLEFVDNK